MVSNLLLVVIIIVVINILKYFQSVRSCGALVRLMQSTNIFLLRYEVYILLCRLRSKVCIPIICSNSST